MTKQRYLKALLELKNFLKEHSEQRKVYSDIHLEDEILRIRYEIIEEERDGFCSRQVEDDGWTYIDTDFFTIKSHIV